MAEKKKISVSNIETSTLPVFEGVSYPSFLPFREKGIDMHIKDMVDFESRETNILLCTFPKSGTHWTHEIIALLLSKRKDLTEDNKIITMFEQVVDLSKLAHLPSPRIFNTHMPFKCLPKKHIENKYKMVHVLRNPKDICVSVHTHYRKDKFIDLDVSWQEYFNIWLDEELPYGSWYKYEAEFEKAESDYPGLIYTMYYEDLKKNPIKEIKNLAHFLNVECTDERAKEINEVTAFQNMKNYKNDGTRALTVDGEGFVYRKGIVGDWKEWFTVSQNERFDRQFKEKMKNSTYKFSFEL